MANTKIRRFWVLAATATAVPLMFASIVAACTALATMDSPQSGKAVEPGSTVEGTGKGFSAASPNEVEIRFDKRDGEVLWHGRPSPQGTVNFSFKVPNVPSGQYVILGVQNDASGNPVAGSPARMSLEIQGPPPSGSSSPAPATAPEQAPTPAASPAPASSAAPARERAVAPAVASPVAPATASEVPALAPAPETAPVPAPAATPGMKRTMTVPSGSGSLLLPLALVGAGILLTMGAAAYALSSRREAPTAARFRR